MDDADDVFEMDSSSDAGSIQTVTNIAYTRASDSAPGSDSQSDRGTSVFSVQTTDDLEITHVDIEQTREHRYVRLDDSSAAAAAAACMLDATANALLDNTPTARSFSEPPPLCSPDSTANAQADRPLPPSQPNTPRNAAGPGSIRWSMSFHVRTTVANTGRQIPTVTSIPALDGRAPIMSRSGSIAPCSGLTTIARASIAMRRCKVVFPDDRPRACLFCSTKYCIGHAVITLAHKLRADDSQLCVISVDLICCKCAPDYLSRADAIALPIKTYSHTYLLRRFTFFISCMQSMIDAPVPRIDYLDAVQELDCIICKRALEPQVQSMSDSVVLLRNTTTNEYAVFPVCTRECRSNVEKKMLPALNANRTMAPVLMRDNDTTGGRLYHGPKDCSWESVQVQRIRELFPRGLNSDTPEEINIHGWCDSPLCVVCDYRTHVRPKNARLGHQHRATLVREKSRNSQQRPSIPMMQANSNFSWLEAVFARIIRENVLLDLLSDNSDTKCAGCGKLCNIHCARCKVTSLCSEKCAKQSKHHEQCFDSNELWSEVFRH